MPNMVVRVITKNSFRRRWGGNKQPVCADCGRKLGVGDVVVTRSIRRNGVIHYCEDCYEKMFVDA